mmetsp:Transcript_37093/g.97526  ORF Transcript_37093/g.97526 Transcript_37093/m.97526 type:complete len:168 (-) Transcript_37093:18-521(-)
MKPTAKTPEAIASQVTPETRARTFDIRIFQRAYEGISEYSLLDRLLDRLLDCIEHISLLSQKSLLACLLERTGSCISLLARAKHGNIRSLLARGGRGTLRSELGRDCRRVCRLLSSEKESLRSLLCRGCRGSRASGATSGFSSPGSTIDMLSLDGRLLLRDAHNRAS